MHRNLKGTIIPLVGIMLISILGIGALVLDLSNAYLNTSKVKNALDLSVLAGISQLTNQENVAAAKNTVLNYLNLNLSMSLTSFSNLSLDSQDLSIQAGTYNFNNMTFSWDELSPTVNSLMISFSYESPTYLASIFMIRSVRISDSTIAVKRPAGQLAPGAGLPIFISSSALTESRLNNNMVDLIQGEEGENSYFTSFSNQNSNANDIRQILDYLEDPSTGIKPPEITVSDSYLINVNNGQLGSVYMALDSSSFEGMTFVAPVGTLTSGNEGRVDGFVGVRIEDVFQSMGDWHISITVIPGYIDNSRSGLSINSGPQNIDGNNQSLLATSFGLVQ